MCHSSAVACTNSVFCPLLHSVLQPDAYFCAQDRWDARSGTYGSAVYVLQHADGTRFRLRVDAAHMNRQSRLLFFQVQWAAAEVWSDGSLAPEGVMRLRRLRGGLRESVSVLCVRVRMLNV